MNGNHALNLYNETLKLLTAHYHKTHLERMCTELEVEMATYSQEAAGYLQLLQAIKNVKNSDDLE